MTEKYRGRVDDRLYTGESIDIRYNLKRCIHSEECVKRLSGVFDTKRKPWILPDEGKAEEIVAGLGFCPSGALHYESKDGSEEPAPSENRIILWEDGPLQIHGDLSIEGATVSISDERRVTLCRCGASQNKPFCDNSHKAMGFTSGQVQTVKVEASETGGKLHITATPQGSLLIEGNFRIETQEGHTIFTGTKTWLCRCGQSQNKPFCDGTHKKIGFDAE